MSTALLDQSTKITLAFLAAMSPEMPLVRDLATPNMSPAAWDQYRDAIEKMLAGEALTPAEFTIVWVHKAAEDRFARWSSLTASMHVGYLLSVYAVLRDLDQQVTVGWQLVMGHGAARNMLTAGYMAGDSAYVTADRLVDARFMH